MTTQNHLRFVDLFAGLGGFHVALASLGHECVFACEVDPTLRDIYAVNFGLRPAGDLREISASEIPKHDVLCAGFPCQPFSKAGEQLGTNCKLWGDLFTKHVLRILKSHKPNYFIFENVANLERHDGGRTWTRMNRSLASGLGYDVQTKVLSPHDFGIPQIRDRLFIVGARKGLSCFSWPLKTEDRPNIKCILDRHPKHARAVSDKVMRCLSVWNEFLQCAPPSKQLPSFPIWAMEFGATYPFTRYNSLFQTPMRILRSHRGSFGQSLNTWFRNDALERVPSHARALSNAFPRWKQQFIAQNRRFYIENKTWIKPWLPAVLEFEPSMQKLEWNCKGEKRDIWEFVVQFRASGVRVKRPTTAPSLVAMTTTQVPIIAWERRYMTPQECARLQSLDCLKHFPAAATATYKALGNAVNATLVKKIAFQLLHVGSRSVRSRTSAA